MSCLICLFCTETFWVVASEVNTVKLVLQINLQRNFGQHIGTTSVVEKSATKTDQGLLRTKNLTHFRCFIMKKSMLEKSGKRWNYPETIGIIRKAFWVPIFRIIPTPLYDNLETKVPSKMTEIQNKILFDRYRRLEGLIPA